MHTITPPNTSSTARISRLTFVGAMLCVVPGCSLAVMAGKALFGDPKVASAFTSATGEDLTKADKPVIVICDAPHRLLTNNPALQIDIVDRVSRNLETRGVGVVNSGDVASWYDDHGEWGDYSELAAHFDAGFVLHIKLREFEHRVPESENLLQGRAEGHISVYQIREDRQPSLGLSKPKNDWIPVTSVFDRDFALKFPSSYPVPRETRSEDMFSQSFLDRVAVHISQHLYDYKMSESVH